MNGVWVWECVGVGVYPEMPNVPNAERARRNAERMPNTGAETLSLSKGGRVSEGAAPSAPANELCGSGAYPNRWTIAAVRTVDAEFRDRADGGALPRQGQVPSEC